MPLLQRKLFQGMILWNIFAGVLVFGLVVGVLYIMRSGYIADLGGFAVLSIFGYAMLRIIDERFLELFRIQAKPIFSINQNLLSLFSAVAIIFFFYSHTHDVGIYFQYLFLVLVIIFIFDLILARDNFDYSSNGFSEGFKQWSLLLKFGVSVFPGAIAMIIHNISDRWMLEHYDYRLELGLYAIAAKFGAIMNLVVSIFTLAFQPFSMKIIHDDDRLKIGNTLDLLLRYYLLIFGGGFLMLTLIAPILLNFVAPKTFALAITAIPFLTFSAVMFGVTYFSSLGTWKKDKAIRFSLVLIISALINIFLNIFSIPLYGMEGAAISTAISMTILVVLSFIVSQSTYRLPYSSIRVILLLLFQLVLAFLLFLHFSNKQSLPLGLCGFGILIMVLLTIKLGEFNAMMNYVRERFPALFLKF